MRASTRFLVISGVAIGVLVVVAVVLVLIVGGRDTALLPEDTPEGVVQRYLLALEVENYDEAYSYLHSELRAETSYESWGRPISWYEEKPGWKAILGESSVVGDVATVEVTHSLFRPGGLYVDPVRTRQLTFYLEKEGTSWGITSPTWLGFLYY